MKKVQTIPIILFSLILEVAVLQNAKGQEAGGIHQVITAGDLDAVRAFLEADSTLLESTDENGFTPLHRACLTRQATIASFLLEKGATVNARSNYGLTPLHLASNGLVPDLDLIRLLLSRGADVNEQLDRGLTALHWVATSDDLEAARFLIDRGANLNAIDTVCYGTVLQMAINMGRSEEMAQLLVSHGAAINQRFTYGNTELHLAALKGYAELTRLLVERGADVQSVNDYNRTPLYYAAKHGFRRVAEVLIAAGANENDVVESNFDKTPQLTDPLEKGEAYLWYLGGLYGGGYAIKTQNHFVVFDANQIDESQDAGLANGKLNPNELAGQNVAIFITKTMGISRLPQLFETAKRMPDTEFVFDSKPGADSTDLSEVRHYQIAAPHQKFTADGIRAHAIPAMGHGYGGAEGLGYFLEVDGLKIFHAGFHVSSSTDRAQMETYRKEIDYLKSLGPIDIAILTVSGHLPAAYESYLYLVDQLSPEAVYLMGGESATEEYPTCARVLQVRNIPVAYPEGGTAFGERFFYSRN